MTKRFSKISVFFVFCIFLCPAITACLVNSHPRERDADGGDGWDLWDEVTDDQHPPDGVDADGRDDQDTMETEFPPDGNDPDILDPTDADADKEDGDIMDAIDEAEIGPVENLCNLMGGGATEIVNDIVHTMDGGYLLAGMTRSYGVGLADMLLVKLNRLLEVEWAQTIGSGEDDMLFSAVESGPGQYVLAGWTQGFELGGQHLLIVSINAAGTIDWAYAFGGFGASGVTKTSDGGYFVAGSTTGIPGDIRGIKISALGAVEWAISFGWPGDEWVGGVVQAADNGFVVTGAKIGDGAANQDVILAKLDSTGTMEWFRRVGGTMNDNAESIHLTSDDGFLISGTTDSYGPENNNVMLMKFDSSGTFSWGRTLGSPANEQGKDSIELADGSFAVVGYSYETFGEDDMLAAHLDAGGTLLWARLISGITREEGHIVRAQPGGGYVLAGFSTDSIDSNTEIFLVTIADDGAACTGSSVILSTGTFTPNVNSELPTVTPWTPTPDTVEPNASFCTPVVTDCCY